MNSSSSRSTLAVGICLAALLAACSSSNDDAAAPAPAPSPPLPAAFTPGARHHARPNPLAQGRQTAALLLKSARPFVARASALVQHKALVEVLRCGTEMRY